MTEEEIISAYREAALAYIDSPHGSALCKSSRYAWKKAIDDYVALTGNNEDNLYSKAFEGTTARDMATERKNRDTRRTD